MSKTTKSSETARATQFIAEIGKHLAGVTQVTFASAAHAPADLTKAFQTLVDLRAAVVAAKAALKAKLTAESAQQPSLVVLMDGFEAYVKLTYSEQPDVLSDFGLTPKKAKTPLTAEQQAAANAKSAATRKARGTVGSTQRKSVKGAVVGVVVTPVTSVVQPAAPATQTAPAPATPPASAASVAAAKGA